MKCPTCGADATGNFCASCGSPLKTKKCHSCGAPQAPGTRFCTACGTQVSREAGSRGGGGKGSGPGPRGAPYQSTETPPGESNLAWWVAGALLVVVLVALGYPVLSRGPAAGGGTQAPPGMGGATGGANVVDLTTMSLEEQGTLLFNRVMTASSNGDTADVEFFLPKALVIYEQLNPPDADGRYHYALLYQVGGDFEAALAKAREGLEEIPDYLLLLAVAAQASVSLGDDAGAREYYGRYLDAYDAEMTLMRPGYEHHTSIFPIYRDEARAYLGVG